MSIFGFIWRNLDRYRTRFVVVCAAAVVCGASGFLVPVVLADATAHPLKASEVPSLVATVVGLYVVNLVFARVVRGSGEALTQQFGNHMRLKYFARLDRLSVSRLAGQHSGYTLSLVGKVTDGMGPILFSVFWELTPGVVVAGLFFYYTTAAAPVIGLVNLVLLGTFVAVGFVLSRRMVPLSAELNRRRAALIESYVDFTGNIMTVRKLGLYRFAASKLRSGTASNSEQIDRVQSFHGNRWLLLHTLFGAAYLGTLAFLLARVSDGRLAVSILILFVGAYGRVRGLIEGLSETVKAFMEMRAYIASLEGAVASPEPRHGAVPALWDTLTMDGVLFDYDGAGPQISVPSFTLRRGETVCVVGESGSGKTTFVSLLANYLTPASGRCAVDGRPYADLDRAFFDSQVALVSQETELFNLSLRDNLTLGMDVADATIVGLLGEVGLSGWYAELDDSLDTQVGENGVRLSAGQKQRVNLLRGVLLDRQLVILDEPTAHLDAATEQTVVDFIRRRLADRTVVCVTHRPALQDLCSRMFAIEGHRLVGRLAVTI